MAVVALIVWLLTAVGGSTMLGLWLARGGMTATEDAPPTHFPVPVIFGHVGLAVVGLILWIIYMVTDAAALAWLSFVVLIVIALLGFTMLTRWLPSQRIPRTEPGPPERAIPMPVVAGHGVLAVATLVLVLIATIMS